MQFWDLQPGMLGILVVGSGFEWNKKLYQMHFHYNVSVNGNWKVADVMRWLKDNWIYYNGA